MVYTQHRGAIITENITRVAIKIKVRRSVTAVKLPAYQTSGSSGADISACISESIEILAGETAIIPTGLYLEIPPGYEVQVRPRSGLAAKHSVTVLNSPGTIDSDYRGELKVILINHGKQTFKIENGDRIAQIVAASVTRAEFEAVDSLSESERGEGGFGHTGTK